MLVLARFGIIDGNTSSTSWLEMKRKNSKAGRRNLAENEILLNEMCKEIHQQKLLWC